MGELRDRMDGELRPRGLSQVTRREYLRCAAHFAGHYRVSPTRLGAEDVRRYLRVILALLGHASICTTVRHVHVSTATSPPDAIAAHIKP